jgi:hypothetical protein
MNEGNDADQESYLPASVQRGQGQEPRPSPAHDFPSPQRLPDDFGEEDDGNTVACDICINGSTSFATTHGTAITYPTSYSTCVQSVDLRLSLMRKPPISASAKHKPPLSASAKKGSTATISDRLAKAKRRRPLQTQKRREHASSFLGSAMLHHVRAPGRTRIGNGHRLDSERKRERNFETNRCDVVEDMRPS